MKPDITLRLLAMRATSPDPATLEEAVREISRLRLIAERPCQCEPDGLAGRGA
jgi:hypothetical protein